MTAVLLALGAALSYGLSDFVAGLTSRRVSSWSVAVAGAVVGTLWTTLLATALPGEPRAADLLWGSLSGLGGGLGGAFLYRGLSRGRMGVVGPVSAVGAALVPLVVGLLAGERPTGLAWAGIALALPAIWLVAQEPPAPLASGVAPAPRLAAGLVDGLLAGTGFGVLFAVIGQVPESAGLWPIAVSQGVSLLAVIGLATAVGGSWRPGRQALLGGSVVGTLSVLALAGFLLAAQQGLLTVSAVLASLYPAATVLLARLLLDERLHRTQSVGLALAAVTVVCVALG